MIDGFRQYLHRSGKKEVDDEYPKSILCEDQYHDYEYIENDIALK
jgi:hypothetical protein